MTENSIILLEPVFLRPNLSKLKVLENVYKKKRVCKESGFTSIPASIYWTIVTLTTVGYGDISPVTPLGQFIASFVMILGYGIIAVPTGIVTAEIAKNSQKPTTNGHTPCEGCGAEDYPTDANYCPRCGHKF